MKKKIVSCILCAAATISLVSGCGSNKETETDKKEAHAEKSVQSEDRNYEPVTIQLNLERSGLGKNVEYTFKQKPDHVVASGDQMADLFFDLGLEEQMAGYTKGLGISCKRFCTTDRRTRSEPVICFKGRTACYRL